MPISTCIRGQVGATLAPPTYPRLWWSFVVVVRYPRNVVSSRCVGWRSVSPSGRCWSPCTWTLTHPHPGSQLPPGGREREKYRAWTIEGLGWETLLIGVRGTCTCILPLGSLIVQMFTMWIAGSDKVVLLATLFISGTLVNIPGILSAMKTLDKVCC